MENYLKEAFAMPEKFAKGIIDQFERRYNTNDGRENRAD
jgi:hypothetical protein